MNKELNQHPEQAEGAQGEREDVIADRNYVAGMQAGWNFAESADEAGFKRAIDTRLAGIRAALAQPSSKCATCNDEAALIQDGELIPCPGCAAAPTQSSPALELDPLGLAPHAAAFNEATAEALKPAPELERPEVVAALRLQVAMLVTCAGNVAKERDAAQAKLAAMEQQEPIKISDDVREFLKEWIGSAVEDDDHDFANQLGMLLDPIYATPVAQAGQVPDVDDLANFIRFTDGNHKMGAGVLAERICDWLAAPQPNDPVGDDHE